jgi:hypothetical protein
MTNTRKLIMGGAVAFGALVLIAACSSREAVPVVSVQPPQPPVMNAVPQAPVTVVQAAPPANDGFLTGMLMGHLMSGGGGGVSRNTTVINKSYTTVNRPAYSAPRPSYSRPSYSYSRSSSFGSFRRR